MKFDIGLEKFLIKMELRNQAQGTVKNNRHHVGVWIEWLNDNYAVVDSQHLRRFHLNTYQEHLGTQNKYKPSYINQRIIAVNGFLRFLRREGELIPELPEVLECLREPELLPKVISLDEYDLLVGAVDTSDCYGYRDMIIISLFMNSAIRLNELFSLDVKDIDLKERTVRVLGKGNKERLAVFGEEFAKELNHYLEVMRPLLPNSNQSALFISRNSNRLSLRAIQDIIKKYAKKAGVESHISCHTLRRTFCTELIKAGGNLYHIAKLMGHSSLENLNRYTYLDMQSLRETHERCHPRR